MKNDPEFGNFGIYDEFFRNKTFIENSRTQN
jgi:hypothetical protein